MTTEFLKGLGLEQGVIDSIMSEKGKEVSALQAKYGDYDDVKKQLADANKQISAFKDMDIDGIKKAADDWKTKAETAEADANKKIACFEGCVCLKFCSLCLSKNLLLPSFCTRETYSA
mgnify:CR=1 FL=1